MSVNIKQNGELIKIANNVSIVQADWNDRENTNKNTSIKNQPETIKTLEGINSNVNENSLAGATAVKELNDKVPTKTSQLTNDAGFKSSSDIVSEYDDIMANAVAGYIPDALAMKEGFQKVNSNLVTYNKNKPIVADLLAEADKGVNAHIVVGYNSETLNTPYTDNLVGTYTSGTALINMSSSTYGHITVFIAGTSQIFNRCKTSNGWSNWKCVNPTEYEIYSSSTPTYAGSHNCIYRGRMLGDSVSESQYAAIAAGTFDNMYIGDYWKINNITYRIAAFDYYYNTGDTICLKHHVVLVPDISLYTHAMNDTDVITGAYVGSKMYTEGLNQAKEMINTAFGADHVLSHRQYLYNTVNTGGFTTTGAWYDSTVELMNERNVYGNAVFSNQINGTSVASNYTVDKSQYPLFAYRPDMISNRRFFWLRDVAFSERFCAVASDGIAGTSPSSTASAGVRPAFCIC